MPTSRLDIDLAAIERNLRVLREVVGADAPAAGPAGPGSRRSGVSVCAVLKQDGYGVGAARVGKRLAAAGVDAFSVYTLEEARALAEAVASVPILVLMPIFSIDRQDPLYRHAASGRVHVTVHGADQLTALSETASRLGVPLPAHVQIDTGLARGGVTPPLAGRLVERVLAAPMLRLAGMMTHFASPGSDDAFTREQARLFRETVEHVKPAIKSALASGPTRIPIGATALGPGSGGSTRPQQDIALHAANSVATFRSKALHGSMVRCGQSLLGYLLEDGEGTDGFEFAAQARSLEPSVRWTSGIVHVAEIPAGWSVGYGSTWRAPHRADGRSTKIALVPVGYADGYPRHLGGRGGGGPGWVGLTGRAWDRRAGEDETPGDKASAMKMVYAPVVGRVSMDQITVDVTDVPEAYLRPAPSAHAGNEHVLAEVELYGRVRAAPNYLPRLAAEAGSITHELLCRISPRVERVYRLPASQPESAQPVRFPAGGAGGAGPTVTTKTGGAGGGLGSAAVAR